MEPAPEPGSPSNLLCDQVITPLCIRGQRAGGERHSSLETEDNSGCLEAGPWEEWLGAKPLL